MPTESSKPIMSRKEATLHTSRAAASARRKAIEKGADETAVDALLTTGETMEVAGMTLKPYTVATLWALQRVGSKYVEEQAAPADVFARLDTNADGKLSKDDILGGTRLGAKLIETWFALVDKDADGFICLSEFVAARGLPKELQAQDIIVAAMCFAEPRETWTKAGQPDGLQQIELRAFDIALEVGKDEMVKINTFINRQFAILEGLGQAADEVGKSPAPAGASANGKSTTAVDPPGGS